MNKILIVDDSYAMRKIIMRVLRQTGLEIDGFAEAANGVEGLSTLEMNPEVDLVISDINMPQMDGIAFVKAIRNQHDKGDLPVLMISNEPASSLVQAAIELGANGSLEKPFTAEGLKGELLQYFG